MKKRNQLKRLLIFKEFILYDFFFFLHDIFNLVFYNISIYIGTNQYTYKCTVSDLIILRFKVQIHYLIGIGESF